jgi:hypothetical protein
MCCNFYSTTLQSLLLDLCVMGTHVYRLGLFICRNRYDRGRVLGALCGTLADYLQHYRRQILSLRQAGVHLLFAKGRRPLAGHPGVCSHLPFD